MTNQTDGLPVSRMMAITPETATPPKALNNKNSLRSNQSATAPERMPNKNNGAIRAAADTPTMKAEPVISKTNQPTATCSMPVPKE